MTEKRQSFGKKILSLFRLLLMTLLPVGVLLIGIIVFTGLISQKKPPPQKQMVREIPQVEVIKLQPKKISLDIEGYGTVRPQRELKLTPEVSGKVIRLASAFKKGGFVKKDEVVVEIDQEEYQINVQSAQANVDMARADLEQLQKNRLYSERRLKLLRERVKLAKRDYSRLQRSGARGAISVQKMEQAKSALLQEQQTLLSSEESQATLPAQIKKAQATLANSRAALKKAKYNLQRTRIKAPFSAQVIDKKTEIGQSVSPGTELGRLAYDKVYEIPVMIDAREIYKIEKAPSDTVPEQFRKNKKLVGRSKATVYWKPWDDTELIWQGQLARIEPIDQKTRTIPLIVEIKNPWDSLQKDKSWVPLLTGTYCKVIIAGQKANKLWEIPEDALREDETVYLLRNGHLAIEKVVVLNRVGDKVVIAPLTDDDKTHWQKDWLITSPISYPIPNMPLQAKSRNNN
jgi:multidrug efflux pump subunit AcrA (membrane-fusion protein)